MHFPIVLQLLLPCHLMSINFSNINSPIWEDTSPRVYDRLINSNSLCKRHELSSFSESTVSDMKWDVDYICIEQSPFPICKWLTNSLHLPWFFSLSRFFVAGRNISMSSGTFLMTWTAHNAACQQTCRHQSTDEKHSPNFSTLFTFLKISVLFRRYAYILIHEELTTSISSICINMKKTLRLDL